MKVFTCIIILLAIVSCNNKHPQIVEPPCVADQVIYFSENEACDTGASVREYNFEKDVVYVFDHGICPADFEHAVVNYDCDTIGYLGGLAENTEINGKEFYEKAEFVRTLFEN
ncbi:MAG: hypothetical protein GQ574_21940 [Crocinitomix sp.]|nr:hypothetical protein [Crocinitomix sp.]